MKQLLSHCDILMYENSTFRLLKNAYLGINNETIDYIGETKPENSYEIERNLKGKMLIPGLINAHTHAAMVLLRGVGSDLPLKEWLFDKIMPMEKKLKPEDLSIGTELAMLEMLASGITSYSDMYMLPMQTAELVKASGMKANLTRVVQSFKKEERYEDNFKVKESLDFFHNYNGYADNRILVDFCVHAEYTCFPQIVEPYSEACRTNAGRMHIHLAETKKEFDECIEKYGKTPTQWFHDLGTFQSPTAAAHCVWMTDEDLSILAENHVSVVHNPTSNMKLGSGFAAIEKMLKKGINVAIGTDGAASNNNLNMFEEIHLASVIHNGHHNDPVIISPTQVLQMATLNGAKLQGRNDTGALEVGKKADIVAIDTSNPHMIPNINPEALLVYSAQSSDVYFTMVNGKILYELGEYKTLDAEKICYEAQKAAWRLHG